MCHGFRSSMVRAQEPTKRPLWLMNTYDKGDVPNPWGKHMLFRDNIGKIEKIIIKLDPSCIPTRRQIPDRLKT